MHYPRAFFDLNYHFALRIAEISGIPLADALLKYTHIYLAFRLGRSFDPACSAWAVFLDGLHAAEDPVGWIFATYTRLTGGEAPELPEPRFGAFSYALWDSGRVRLHFWGGPPGASFLSRAAIPARTGELAALLQDIRQNVPNARSMVGGSWLYNIEAYRRLFPPAYLETAKPEEPETQFIALWGQFLDHQRQVKPEIAQRFLDQLETASTLDEALHAFPYPVLRLESPIEVFYASYLGHGV